MILPALFTACTLYEDDSERAIAESGVGPDLVQVHRGSAAEFR